jgi:hypothetical protein
VVDEPSSAVPEEPAPVLLEPSAIVVLSSLVALMDADMLASVDGADSVDGSVSPAVSVFDAVAEADPVELPVPSSPQPARVRPSRAVASTGSGAAA